MRDCQLKELTLKVRTTSSPVVFYGAAFYCKLGLFALGKLGLKANFICDSDERRWGENFCGFEIISPEDLRKIPRDAHIFVSSIFLAPIISILEKQKFTNIYSCVSLFNSTDFSDADIYPRVDQVDQAESCVPDCNINKENYQDVYVNRQIELYRNECLKFNITSSVGLNFKYMDVVITEACSMKCIDCSNLMQYYTNPKHSDLLLLFDSLDKLLECIDSIGEFRVLGGEPFVNKKIHKVIDKLVSYENVNRVVIYTNATITPKGENLRCLQHAKVMLDITNYGTLSRNYTRLIETLDDNNIPYVSRVPQWTDSGRILPYQERTNGELKHMFENCCVNDVLTLLNGKLYRCPFSANATNLDAIPYSEDDVIELAGYYDAELLKEKLTRFQKNEQYLTACSYCNGRDYSTPLIEAAIQSKIPLPIPIATS